MSTRSNIAIRINDSEIGKTFIHTQSGIDVTLGKYMTIYCHHDGYISGVGTELFNNYNTYDRVLDLIMDGDCSAIGAPYYKREGYENNIPKSTYDKPRFDEEYGYLFENGKWHVSSVKHPEYNGELEQFIKNKKEND